MTLEEKKALQGLLIDEVQARLEAQPTLLVDALLQGNGYALLHGIVRSRLTAAQGATQALSTLLKGMMADRGEEAAA